MRSAILIRHAKAGEDADDHRRPLAERGRRDSRSIGQALRAHGVPAFPPDLVLCSSARRCRQTWEGISKGLSETPPLELRDELYLASAATLLGTLQALPAEVESALVIAHEPGLSQLIGILLASGPADLLTRVSRGMKPGSFAAFRFSLESWRALAPGSGELVEFLRPKDLRNEK